MPRERKPQFNIFPDLNEASVEADSTISEFEQNHDILLLDVWLIAAKETILKIKNCNSTEEIVYPPDVSNYFVKENLKGRKFETTIPEIQKDHVHNNAHVQSEADDKVTKQDENYKMLPELTLQTEIQNCDKKIEKHEKITTPADNSNANLNPTVICLSVPQIKEAGYPIIISESNSSTTQDVIQTPVLHKTFDQVINRTFTTQHDISSINCPKPDSEHAVCNNSGMKTRSSSKVVTPNKNIASKSGSKRKSPKNKDKSNKKRKIESSKSTQARHPLVERSVIKIAAAMTSESKAKISAVIKPTLQKKSVISKEMLVLEEIKKKDEKANENIKKVLAERQMKVEQKKKNREEKMTKTMQKRLQLEKEKERLQKVEIEAKIGSKPQSKATKENINNGASKTRTQELIDKSVKESAVLRNSKQNEVNEAVLKTPVPKLSDDFNNYEITPLPNSSTYNFSDSEDEAPVGKPIPQWAQGVLFKSALVQQYYNPPNVDKLFGTKIDSPDLKKIFSVEKKKYSKRTSSAVWDLPPSSHY